MDRDLEMKHSTHVSFVIPSTWPIAAVHGGRWEVDCDLHGIHSGTCGGLWVEKYILRENETLLKEKLGFSPLSWEHIGFHK